MGTLPIIPVQPALHFGPGFAQGVKQFGVEQFIPQRAVEALQGPGMADCWPRETNLSRRAVDAEGTPAFWR